MADDKKKPNPSPPGIIERLRGKRTSDIRLPSFNGSRDRRLGKESKAEEMRRGWDVIKGLAAADKK